ncbi:LysR family transcriptional regulator [Janthinobacterium agaricidamnosum]|uniref:Bacterial regulatory helix-turn-helix, lysR family protein n=1 Tax=Janthinobacterium agaricidamnosum NBRC 102515 = DSM 9628 TaxID=1349767 RepID=W0V1C8_9BURK|nr:LysR family transcriptional regulator [Janthinobacterium agaricidamnosum]CDG82629.1 bacterial regulatory helix-turn-helix, lysR family protein [Janthinobacterium agaricidamnosum NBRC 102515 = DSM 9628]
MTGFDGRLAAGLGVLAAVVDSGSFVRAAELLEMTQSGVSRAVARLEARLGIRVFHRTTRSVTLTDEGRRFYESVAPLLGSIEEAAAMASGTATQVRGKLRVHCDPFFSRLLLAPRLGEFLAEHPELELEIVTRDQLGDLVADGFDLAVRFGQPQQLSLVIRKLFDIPILTVAAPGYIARHGLPRHPSELENGKHMCVHFRDPHSAKVFPWEFHRGKEVLLVEPKAQLTLNEAGTLHAICIAGHGIAQMMDLGLQPLLRSGALVSLFPEWRDELFPLYALYPSRHLPPAKVRAFMDFILTLKE